MQTDKPGFRTSFRITCVLLYEHVTCNICSHSSSINFEYFYFELCLLLSRKAMYFL